MQSATSFMHVEIKREACMPAGRRCTVLLDMQFINA
jgi:hypothetical protein